MFVKKFSMMTTIPFLNQGRSVRIILAFLAIFISATGAYSASSEFTVAFNDGLPPCDNVTSAGTISGTQSSCGSFYPTTIISTSPASGGTGPVEYQWMYKNASTSWNLTAIPGATSVDYTPGLLSETTKFIRCSRNQGCTSWPGETADVTITVTNACCNVTNAGSISGNQSGCGSFDPNTITSNAPASGGSNNPEYIWMFKNASNGWSFTAIPGTNSETYDPGTLTETTVYRRCARNLGCSSWPGETNDITITVNPAGPSATATSTNAVCTDTTRVCNMTDYNGSRTIWLPNLGGTSGVSLFKIVNNSAKLYQFSDGTAHYTGKAQKTNDANKEWVFSIWFKDKKDWTAWSATGGSYKNGGGLTNAHLNWDYYIMDASKPNKMVGIGDYAGVELSLTHKPSNYQYAMQLGLGANDQDGDYGMSFWFEYTSSSSAYSSGHGDYNADAPTCNNVATCGGTASASVSGGTSPYAYEWTTGVYGNELKGLCTGTYSVTVTDANGCTSTASTTISTTVCCNSVVAGSISGAQSNCGSFDPAVITSTTPASGSGAIEYIWIYKNASTGNTFQTVPGATSETYDPGLVTETTTYRRCARIVGCTAWLGESNDIVMTVNPALTVTTSSTDATCNGSNTGTASATASNGTSPYTFLWSTGATTEAISGLNSGTYNVTITDANGCTGSGTVNVNEPTVLTSTSTSTDVTCNGDNDGTASMSASGGTAPYTYSWDNGGTTASITGLAPGTYVGTATDANGCTTVETVTITEPTVLTSTSTSTDVTCNGDNDGTASMSASGGTAPYTYSWDNGATTASITGLAPGTYVGTATDANGCTTVETVTITEPTVLTSTLVSSVDATGAGAADGSATVSASGGSPAYTYLWSDGQTTATATGLLAGTYTVTITDANGCTTTETVVINEPMPLTSTVTSTDVLCNGGNDGTAMIMVSGGVSPYTYLWSNGATTASITGLVAGTYTVTATDANGYTTSGTAAVVNEPTVLTSTSTSTDVTCNGDNDGAASMSASGGTAPYTYSWDNGATTASITGLAPGTYVGTATDANGCTTVETVTITEPTVLTSTSTSTDVTCNGDNDGTASMSASGGTAPYTYSWDNGATTASITGLAPGTYVGTATDANGCTTVETVTITEPTVLTSTSTSTDVTCNGDNDGAASMSASGGTAPYTYSWDNGGTTASITGLAPGTYVGTATDANGCTTVETVTITEPTVLTSTSTSTDVTCNGDNDGTASMSASGGTAPYTYSWDNGGTTASITGLAPGTYVGTATDANGCTTVETVTITEPTERVQRMYNSGNSNDY